MTRAGCGPLPADVQRRLATARLGRRIFFYPEIASTNDAALELARRGEPEGTVVMADHQRAGRGRRGHTWSSPPQRDVLMSLVLRPGTDAREALPVTLVTALSIAVVLSKLLDVEVGVKWPERRRVCARQAGGHPRRIVFLASRACAPRGRDRHQRERARGRISAGLRYPAASCRTLTGQDWDRADIAADVLGTIEAYYDRLRRDGFAPLRAAYEARLVHLHRDVAFEHNGVRASASCAVSRGRSATRRAARVKRDIALRESIEVAA
jgi:BirA family biotin operon repressor/biotin-[acetyl-CoA-carboxylase] ligase